LISVILSGSPSFLSGLESPFFRLSSTPLNASTSDVLDKNALLNYIRTSRDASKVSYKNVTLPFQAPTTSLFEDLQEIATVPKAISTKTRAGIVGGEKARNVAKSPQLPQNLTKRIFQRYAKYPVAAEVYPEIAESTPTFFKQITKDLVAFSSHAHRKTIDKSDVECLLKRQRIVTPEQSLEDVLRKHLPLECTEELIPVAKAQNTVIPKMKFSSKIKIKKKKKSETEKN